MKDFIKGMMAPLAKSPYLYAFIMVILIMASVRMFMLYQVVPVKKAIPAIIKK